jgi:hypothetical protein
MRGERVKENDAGNVNQVTPPRGGSVEERIQRVRRLRESMNGPPLTEESLRQAINAGRSLREYVAVAGMRPVLPSKLFGRKPKLP